jgi:hypothetical protein
MTALTPLPDQKSLLPLSLTLPEPRNAISWGVEGAPEGPYILLPVEDAAEPVVWPGDEERTLVSDLPLLSFYRYVVPYKGPPLPRGDSIRELEPLQKPLPLRTELRRGSHAGRDREAVSRRGAHHQGSGEGVREAEEL